MTTPGLTETEYYCVHELVTFLSGTGLLAARRPYIVNCRISTFEGPKTVFFFFSKNLYVT